MSKYTKSSWYSSSKVDPVEHNVFSKVDEKAHQKRRAQVGADVGGHLFSNHQRKEMQDS